jgi:hypothetical protein
MEDANHNGIDLTQFDTEIGAEAGFELQLLHPATGKPLPAWITVLGEDSTAYHAARQQALRARREQTLAGPNLEVAIEDQTVALLVAATKSWRGILENGAEVTCTPASAERLYRKRGWRAFREQVDQAIHHRANFLPASATS